MKGKIMFEFFVASVFLSAMTLVLIFLSNLFSATHPELNTYYLGIVSGATGGIWGYVLAVVYDTKKEIKTNPSFMYPCQRKIVILICSIIVIIIMAFLIYNVKIN